MLVSIVDDELDITVLFSEVLQTIGETSISTFTDPILALEHFTINKANYVLVISDLKMLGLNGMELLKKVKKLNPSVRTIPIYFGSRFPNITSISDMIQEKGYCMFINILMLP
jgi:response regulator RpfG family c-di-GMP phosphodiesterase